MQDWKKQNKKHFVLRNLLETFSLRIRTILYLLIMQMRVSLFSYKISKFDCLEETITSWIVQPWIVVGTSETRLQIDELSGHLLRCQTARVNSCAWRLWVDFDRALLLPWIEALYFARCLWILHPLNDLCVGDKIHIAMIGENLIDPVEEGVEEFGIILEPCSVEVETEWSTVCIVVTFKVVIEKGVKLITCKSGWQKTINIFWPFHFSSALNSPVKMLEHESTIAQPGISSSMLGSSRRSSSFITSSHTACDRVGQLCRLPWHLCGIRKYIV